MLRAIFGCFFGHSFEYKSDSLGFVIRYCTSCDNEEWWNKNYWQWEPIYTFHNLYIPPRVRMLAASNAVALEKVRDEEMAKGIEGLVESYATHFGAGAG